jgi:hypothetical protein
MALRETGCEDGKWIELAHDRGQLQVLVLAVLNLQDLLPEGSHPPCRESKCPVPGFRNLCNEGE